MGDEIAHWNAYCVVREACDGSSQCAKIKNTSLNAWHLENFKKNVVMQRKKVFRAVFEENNVSCVSPEGKVYAHCRGWSVDYSCCRGVLI